MTKHLLWGLCLWIGVVLTAQAQNTSRKTDLQGLNIQGAVLSFEETWYLTDAAGQRGAVDRRIVYYVNEKGFFTLKKTYDAQGNLTLEEEYIFSANNGVLEWRRRQANGERSVRSTISAYPSGNLSIAHWYNDQNQVTLKQTFQEDDALNIITLNEADANNILTGGWKYQYSPQRHVLRSSRFDESQRITYHTTYRYNQRQDMIEMQSLGADSGQLLFKSTFQYLRYDQKGNWTSRRVSDQTGKPIKIEERIFQYR